MSALNKEDKDLLLFAKKRFSECVDFEDLNRPEMVDDLKFKNGDSSNGYQWPDHLRNSRQQDNRLMLTINKLRQFINQVKNDQRQNRPAIKIRPVDDLSDIRTAKILQGIIRNIENQSNADIAYDTAFESSLSCGIGYWRVVTQYENDESFNQEIFIKPVKNAFSAYLDPSYQSPDGSDAEFGFISEWMPEEDFKKQFPDHKKIDWDETAEGDEDWFEDKKVLIVEYFYKENIQKQLHLLEDGSTTYNLPQGIKPVRSRIVTVPSVKWCKLSGSEILEKSDWPGKYIPIIPVVGNDEIVDGKRIISGLIRFAKDSQRMYNFWRTAATEMVALAPKAPFIGAAGQFENFERRWSQANAKDFAYLEYNPVSISGQLVPTPQRNPYSVDVAAFTSVSNMAEHDIQTTMGIYNASLGERSNERSGKAIMARQKEGDTATFHYIDNLNRSIRHCGRIILDLIPKIYDTQRVVRILGEEGEEENIMLNPEGPGYSEQPSEDGIQKVFNPTIGKYDVYVDVGPSYSTKRQEAVDAMLQLTQVNPSLVQIIGDLMVRNMDWPGADEIAQRLKKMLPPNLQENASPIPPQIQAQIEQAMQQHVQAIEQLTMENNQLKSKQQEKMAEIQSKAFASEEDRKLEAQKIIADYELAKQKLEAEIDLEREKALAEIMLMREKAIAEIEAKKEIEGMKATLNAQTEMCKAEKTEMEKENALQERETPEEEVKEVKEPVMPNVTIVMPNQSRRVKMTRMPDGSLMGESLE